MVLTALIAGVVSLSSLAAVLITVWRFERLICSIHDDPEFSPDWRVEMELKLGFRRQVTLRAEGGLRGIHRATINQLQSVLASVSRIRELSEDEILDEMIEVYVQKIRTPA
jgi:hypothetical protein